MRRLLLWPVAAFFFLGAAYALQVEQTKTEQGSLLPRGLKELGTLPESPKECAGYSYSKSGALEDDLIEMSGLVPSQVYDDLFYHIRDSGNDPLLIMTDGKGKVIGRVPFAESVADTEDLSAGPCPWGGVACLFVADTGDNFGWRRTLQVFAIEEKSLFLSKPRIEAVNFAYEGASGVDVEAVALERSSGELYFFSKEKKKSRVFRLPKAAWTGSTHDKPAVAEFVAEMSIGSVTGASLSADGQRLLLLNSKGVHEFSDRSPWFKKSRLIEVPLMAQQEAVSYLADQRSFLYSSERKSKKKAWGLIQANCQSK